MYDHGGPLGNNSENGEITQIKKYAKYKMVQYLITN